MMTFPKKMNLIPRTTTSSSFDAKIREAQLRLADVQGQVTRELYPSNARPYRFDRYADPMLMYAEPAVCTQEWLARIGPRFDITRRAQEELALLVSLAPSDEQRISNPNDAAIWCVLVCQWLNILWFALGINPRFLIPQVAVYSRLSISDPSAYRVSSAPEDLATPQWMGGSLVRGAASGNPPCFDLELAAANPGDPEAGFKNCLGQRAAIRTLENEAALFPSAFRQNSTFMSLVRRERNFSDARYGTILSGANWYTPRSSFVGNTGTIVPSYMLANAINAWPANRGEPAILGAALGDLTLTNPGGFMLNGWFAESGNWRTSQGRTLTSRWVMPESVYRHFRSQSSVKQAGFDAWVWWFRAEKGASQLIMPARSSEGPAALGSSPRQEIMQLKAIALDVSRLDLLAIARNAFLFWAENHIRWFQSMGEETETWIQLQSQFDAARRAAVQGWLDLSSTISQTASGLLQLVSTIASAILQIAGIVIAPLLKFVAKKGTGPGAIPIPSSGPAYPQPFLIRSIENLDCNLSGVSRGAGEILLKTENLYFPNVRPGAGGTGGEAGLNPWLLVGAIGALTVGGYALLRKKP